MQYNGVVLYYAFAYSIGLRLFEIIDKKSLLRLYVQAKYDRMLSL